MLDKYLPWFSLRGESPWKEVKPVPNKEDKRIKGSNHIARSWWCGVSSYISKSYQVLRKMLIRNPA